MSNEILNAILAQSEHIAKLTESVNALVSDVKAMTRMEKRLEEVEKRQRQEEIETAKFRARLGVHAAILTAVGTAALSGIIIQLIGG